MSPHTGRLEELYAYCQTGKVLFSYSVYRVGDLALPVELLSCELYRTSLVRSQHWFRKWLGAANNPCMLPFLEVHEWSAWNALIKGVCMTTCKTYGIVFLYLFTSLARFCGDLLVLLMPWIHPSIHVRRFTIMFVAFFVSLELLSCELYRTSLMRNQHWFR